MDYWNVQRKGANYFNRVPSEEWFVAAKKTGIRFARLAPDKWNCEQRDFLIGNADSFTEIPRSDLKILKNTLDQAQRNDIKVVITLLSLPGSRWKQNNDGKRDLRIWQQRDYQNQAASFWKALAKELQGHPAVVGYNILNEPHPECLFGIHDYMEVDFRKWYDTIKDSPADLNVFYREIVSAIREVDPSMPIVIDVGLYATPGAISYLTPIDDDNILYSFHMYEPYVYTSDRVIKGKRFSYPGPIPPSECDPDRPDSRGATYWDGKALEQFFRPVLLWQKQFAIPSSRILVGEFGCRRTAVGADKYLSHLIRIFNDNKWHWAFYAFREDSWDGMDYELGAGQLLHRRYRDAVENYADLDALRRDNPIFNILKKELEKPTSSRTTSPSVRVRRVNTSRVPDPRPGPLANTRAERQRDSVLQHTTDSVAERHRNGPSSSVGATAGPVIDEQCSSHALGRAYPLKPTGLPHAHSQ
ncbi:MAG: cellulase family glycosylhydrolase [Simkaniaceae bacterium]|nr:cellulase family glycosylhydrolase [Simkaniaceae bacterium]